VDLFVRNVSKWTICNAELIFSLVVIIIVIIIIIENIFKSV